MIGAQNVIEGHDFVKFQKFQKIKGKIEFLKRKGLSKGESIDALYESSVRKLG